MLRRILCLLGIHGQLTSRHEKGAWPLVTIQCLHCGHSFPRSRR